MQNAKFVPLRNLLYLRNLFYLRYLRFFLTLNYSAPSFIASSPPNGGSRERGFLIIPSSAHCPR